MRLLVVTPFLPDVQAAHGGGMYVGALCRALATHAELGLAALLHKDEDSHLQRERLPFQWLTTTRLPQRPRGLAMRRHQIGMLWRWGVCGMPLVAAKHLTTEFHGVLDRAVAEFQPDAVLIELAQMAQYLPHFSTLPTVLTDHEAGMPANARTQLGAIADRRDARLWRRYVHRYYPQASLLQAVTTEDAQLLSTQLGLPVATRHAVIDIPRRPVSPHTAPQRALFLGDYSHFPNREAAAILTREVLPLLRASADCRTVVCRSQRGSLAGHRQCRGRARCWLRSKPHRSVRPSASDAWPGLLRQRLPREVPDRARPWPAGDHQHAWRARLLGPVTGMHH